MKFLKRPRRSGRKADQRGFTLVELTVTMSVMSVGVLGLLRVSLGGMAVSVGANARTTATAVAAGEIEAMRAVPYQDLGLAASATGFRSSFEGATTVVVASEVAKVVPMGERQQDGLSFAITRDIVWASALIGAGPDIADSAYKRTVVQVDWTDQYGPHQVRQDAGVYPGGLGQYGASTTTTTTPGALIPGAPIGLAAALGPDGSSQVDLTWAQGSPASTTWEIHQSSDNGTTWSTLTTSQPGATSAFSVSGLAQSTTYTFRVRGLLGEQVSAWSTSASATTASAGGVCASLSGSATPSPSSRLASKYLKDNVLVKVNTNGGCAYGLRLRVTPMSGSPAATYTVSMSEVGSEFQYTIAKNTYKWTTGATTFEILDPSNHVITQIAFAVVDAP